MTRIEELQRNRIANELAELKRQNADLRYQNAALVEALRGLILECEYSASSGVPFNFPDGQGRWTQLEAAKALAAQPEE